MSNGIIHAGVRLSDRDRLRKAGKARGKSKNDGRANERQRIARAQSKEVAADQIGGGQSQQKSPSRPAPMRTKISRMIIAMTLLRSVPSAMRIPISRVRRIAT